MIAISQSLRSLEHSASSNDPRADREAAQEFEAMMLAEMLRFGSKPMFGDNPLDGGSAGRMARDQFFTQLALVASRGGGFGLTSELESELAADDEA